MTNNPSPFALRIDSYGPIAVPALSSSACGQVAAVFKNCFYLHHEGVYLCIGNSNFPNGALNVVSSAPEKTNWKACGLKPGDVSVSQNKRLRIGSRLIFDHSNTGIWSPLPATELATSAAAFSVVSRYLEANTPTEGLAPLVLGVSDGPLAQARQALEKVSVWLDNSIQQKEISNCVPAIENILGLGPGLTPSGDDFIGAMMITLQTLNELDSLAALRAAITRHAETHTNPISAQHLYAASQGLGGSAFHHVLASLCTNDSKRQTKCLDQLSSVGHTSGWDALAGLYITLKVWHDAQLSRPVAA